MNGWRLAYWLSFGLYTPHVNLWGISWSLAWSDNNSRQRFMWLIINIVRWLYHHTNHICLLVYVTVSFILAILLSNSFKACVFYLVVVPFFLLTFLITLCLGWDQISILNHIFVDIFCIRRAKWMGRCWLSYFIINVQRFSRSLLGGWHVWSFIRPWRTVLSRILSMLQLWGGLLLLITQKWIRTFSWWIVLRFRHIWALFNI